MRVPYHQHPTFKIFWITMVMVKMTIMISSCSPDHLPLKEHHLSGVTMGTKWKAILLTEHPPSHEELQTELDRLESIFSTWRADSDIQKFNQQSSTEWQNVPYELAYLVHCARAFAALSDGAYDPTIPPLLKLWNFGPGSVKTTTSKKRPVPSAAEINQVKPQVDYRQVMVRLAPPALRKMNPGLQLDLSALVEGFALDHIAEHLQSQSIHHFLFEIGGEMIARGKKSDHSAWTVGIQFPTTDQTQIATKVELHDEAVSTSGTYQQWWQGNDGKIYSHVLDARTGTPVEHALLSVTVKATRALEADAWATVLLILGPDNGKLLAEKQQLNAFFQMKSPR